jgi:TrmH family RNA methyltransferase
MAGPEKSGRTVRSTAGVTAATAGVISSRDNRWLKAFRLTLRGGLTTESGSVGVEGVRLVEEALRSTCTVEAVLLSESGERHRQRLAPLIDRAELGFPVLRTTDRLFEGIADTEHPQGVAALVKPREMKLEDLLQVPESRHSPLLVVLAGVQDPGNVGTILRTAAAFGATGAVAASTGQGGTTSPFSPKALRASAGAALHLPVMEGMSLAILMTQLKLHRVKTVASCVHDDARGDLKAPVCPWEVNWCEPMALLIGNEGAGLPEEVVHGADERIHIPMATKVESLNAAAAAAVLFYEAYRQRSRRE